MLFSIQTLLRLRSCNRHCNALAILMLLVFSTILPGQNPSHHLVAGPLKLQPGLGNPLPMQGSVREVYKQVGDVELSLYIYHPATHPADELKPAIVFFFGGGWAGGTPKQFIPHCEYLASRGMVAVTADYRVKNKHGVWPQSCIADAKSAIRYLRKNAKRLGIDPNRIAAGGGSAGGHLAAATGTISEFDEPTEDLQISSKPNAMVLFNPALMLAELDGSDLLPESFEMKVAEKINIAATRLSPVHHVSKHLPPTIIFHGQADEEVPYASSKLFHEKLVALKCNSQMRSHAGQAHGFFNFGRKALPPVPQGVSNFVETTREMDQFLNSIGYLVGPPSIDYFATDAQIATSPQTKEEILKKHIHLRELPLRCQKKFAEQKTGRVAFLGGSITEMNGFRPLVCQWLQEKYPETEFDFISSGIASTCSTTGAGRIKDDVLSHGQIDLLFIEEAVNDDSDATHPAQRCVRGMEGMVRRVKRESPATDLVLIYFTNPGMLDAIAQGAWPISSGSHDHIASYYGVSSINIAGCLSDLIQTNLMTWEQYGGVHPKKPGNKLAADMVIELLKQTETSWPTSLKDVSAMLPLDSCNYEFLHWNSPKFATTDSQWKFHQPDWKNIPGSFRTRFGKDTFLTSSDPGAQFEFDFQGRAFGLYVLAGPDAGTIEYRVDGGHWKSQDLYHHFSKALHYPRTVMLEETLSNKKHHIEIRISKEKNKLSTGHAVRIMQIAVNGK
ncbi:MAG: alpha/beta hydrolase fold domain-containing protein [Planctomycetaceae bacterium]|nr:alpha/beta hydrolase fold domain-containing protein [Planctomycetaceae bacterium]